jgi:hypothetical protein
MPLPTLETMIGDRVPFLSDTPSDLDKIASKKTEAFYFLQKALGKTDEDVEDESKYTAMEKLLIADFTAYELIQKEVVNKTIGTGSSGGKTIKRVKAADVETEFMFPDKGASTTLTVDTLLKNLKDSICQKATQLDIFIPLCDCSVSQALPMPFIYIEDVDTPPKSLW